MSDPTRLSRLPNGGLAATLIESARDDEPPTSARSRAILALGVSGGALLTASVAEGGATLSAGAAGVGASVAAGGGASTGAGVGTALVATRAVATWGAVAKWVGGGAVAVAVTAGAVARIDAPSHPVRSNGIEVGHSGSPPAPARLPAPSQVRPDVRPVEAQPVEAPLPIVPRAIERERPVHATPLAPSKAVARESIGEATSEGAIRRSTLTGDLVSEIATLDRAREAVSSGAPDRALAALDEYDRRFSAPTLTLESQVLRIEALAQKGDREKAARLAEAFLAQNPSSAHVARVRSLLLSIRKDRGP